MLNHPLRVAALRCIAPLTAILIYLIGSHRASADDANFASVDWTNGGFIDTGAGYDMQSGTPKRTVVDIEVPGSPGLYPLRCARTLRTTVSLPSEFETPRTQWSVDFFYVMWGQTVRYPSGDRVVFNGSANTGDRLEFSGSMPVLRLADGGRVEFSSMNDGDHWVGTRIIDPHGLVTQITPQNFYGPRRIEDASGRWLEFNWLGNGVTSVRSSSGETVRYTLIDQIATSWPLISRVDYADGSISTYRYTGLGESCSVNLPIELNDVRAQSKMQRVRYSWRWSRQMDSCTIEHEMSSTGVVVSTMGDLYREILPTGAERNFIYQTGRPLLLAEYDFSGNRSDYEYDARGFLARIRKPGGRETVLLNEPVAGKRTRVTHPDGSSVSYTYTDPANPYFLESKTDERGGITRYEWFSNGVLRRVIAPDGSEESWHELTEFAQPQFHVLRNGAIEAFEYDERGLLVAHWPPFVDALNGVVRYRYYPAGHPWADLLEEETDPREHTTRYEYARDAQGSPVAGRPLPTRTIYGDGTAVTHEYDDYGNVVSTTDELGATTSFSFDEYQRLLLKTDPLGRTTQYDYTRVIEASLPLTPIVFPFPTHDPLAFTNPLPWLVVSPGGIQTRFAYDDEHRLMGKAEAYGSADEARTTFSYDALGNVVTQVDPADRTTSYQYDTRNRLTRQINPGGQALQWIYDAAGNVVQEVFEDGATSHAQYDAMNRMVTKTDELGRLTRYEYDAMGNLLRVLDPEDRISGYSYDARGNILVKYTPEGNNQIQAQEIYAYDAAGNRVRRTDARGVETIYGYDERNRETSRSYSDDTRLIITSRDDVGRPVFIFDVVPSEGSDINYDYDDAGQVEREYQFVLGTTTDAIEYTYDLDGNVLSASTSDFELAYEYNARKQVEAIFFDDDLLVSYTYGPDGLPTRKESGNGLEQRYTYSPSGRPELLEGLGGIPSKRYVYDQRNRPIRIETNENQIVEELGYDRDSQLRTYRSRRRPGLDPGRVEVTELAFDYDGSGNRTRVVDDGEHFYDVHGSNMYTAIRGASSDTFVRDQAGNLLERDGWSYRYDAHAQMIEAEGPTTDVQLNYDGQGRLSALTQDGVRRLAVHMRDRPFLWRDAETGTLEEVSVWGPHGDELVWTWTPEREFFYHLDAQNNVLATSSPDGDIEEIYTYDPFGAPRFFAPGLPWTIRSESLVSPPYLFTGQRWLPSLGLHHFKARMYDPKLGRFLQPDPKGLEGGDLNLYRYVKNNPMTYVDPEGKAVETLWDIANVAMGAVSMARNIKDGSYGAAALDAVGLALDIAATAVPGVPGGASTALNMKRASDTLVDGARAADRASETASAARHFDDAARGAQKSLNAVPKSVLNTANHVFGPKSLAKHKLGPVLESFGGDAVAATYRLQNAAQALANQGAIKGVFETTVQVAGRNVTVRGAIIDGVANLRTAFIP